MGRAGARAVAYGILRAVAVLVGISLLLYFLYLIRSVLMYILIAAIISLVGRPIVFFLEGKLKFSNAMASAFTLGLFILIGFGLIVAFVPVITDQAAALDDVNYENWQREIRQINDQAREYFGIQRIDFMEILEANEAYKSFDIKLIPQFFSNAFGALGGMMIGMFSVLFIAFFLLKDTRLLLRSVLVFANEGDEGRFHRVFNKIKNLLSRYFVGLVLQLIVIFVLYSFILLWVGIDNAVLIAFVCAFANIIPYVGPIIGGVIATVFVITNNLGMDFSEVILPKLLWVFIGFGIVQLIDNFINQPLIFGNSVRSHPLEIFLAIIIVGILFGVVGMIFAVPLYTAIKVISKEFLSEYKIVQQLTKNL